VTSFDRKIEAMWPDAEVPGWMVCQLECGHITHQPKSNTNTIAHCGVCMLNHEAHVRELAAFQKKQITDPAKEQPHHG
jgi:hypothetical protein